MAGIYNAAVQGIESGFGMGLKADAEAEARRRTDLLEKHQNAQDLIAQQNAQRLQKHQDFADAALADTQEREKTEYGFKAAQENVTDIEGKATALIAGGGAVTPELASQYGGALTQAQAWRQKRMNLASKWQTGQASINHASPADVATTIAATTGFKPSEWAKVPAAIQDAQTALSTGNMAMAIDPLNVMLTPQLMRGIGSPSAHGGTIVAKRIVNAVPAAAPNGEMNPNLILPIIRVVTDQKGPDGQNLYYDAPMTDDGGVDGKIVPLDVSQLVNRMGHMGVLTTALQHPEVAGRKSQGDTDAEAEINKNLDLLRSVATTKSFGVKMDQATAKMTAIHRYAVENGMTDADAALKMQGWGVLPTPKSAVPATGTIGKGVADIKAMRLPPDQEAQAIKNFLTKTTAPSTTQGGGAQLTPEALDQVAAAALKDRTALIGIGRDPNTVKAVLNRMVQLAPDGDIAGARREFSADSKSLDKLIPMYDAVTSFENNTISQGKVLKSLAESIDSTGVPVVERWIRAGRKSITGDPAVSAFNAQLVAYGNEAAKILTNPNLTGVLTVEAQREVRSFLPENANAEQIARVVDLLENDFATRKLSLEDQVNAIKNRMANNVPKPAGILRSSNAVPAATQAARDSDAAKIFDAEIQKDSGLLTQYQASLAKAIAANDTPENISTLRDQIRRKQEDLASLQREKTYGLHAAGAPAPAPAAAASVALPPAALAQLKENVVTTFGNKQRWTLKNGQPVQVQ